MRGYQLLSSLLLWLNISVAAFSSLRISSTRTFHPMTPLSKSRLLLSRSVEGDFDPEKLEAAALEEGIKPKIRALYKFTRPHTIRGTILASIAGTIRALRDTPGALQTAQWSIMLPRAFIGMIALLFGNAFIVGINQIYDQDIDKVNKPFLPVVSGELSVKGAWAAVVASAIFGPILVYNQFPRLLFKLYMLGLSMGLVYSVPPLRTKQNPLAAGLTIATVRGFLLNFGVYYAVKDAIGAGPFAWSPKVAFIARFMTVFAMAIAVTKDLPDVEGDEANQIETWATKLGIGKMARLAAAGLGLNYVHAVITGICGNFGRIMIPGHVALAALLITRVRQLDPESMASVKIFYKHIWDLFYLEYVLYTLI